MELVLSPWGENTLYDRREKPATLLDWPVDATDYELVISSTGRRRPGDDLPDGVCLPGGRAGGDH